ncbi:TRAP transporter substrate-binding protein [Paracraurococcus ruber]|uniref:ABC transporter substrate-binding protein n=1 Tax=Paracraurococcus ruber TaxID=77675 RepID=A0ABS1D134_9PROT|nr:TRAP transporter substrate-binding protein DctP [Paracraurococcus ruber]MBK1660007.1 ABC transporter substrate-binding protein [Paracraurococcus ruber]TDG28719.1 ABC transporter substrate-binding protein [Paracraurococcus ruber]
MDRRLFLGAAGGAAALAAPAIAQTNPEIRWRMPSSFPRTLDVLYGSCERLGRRVAELTDGKFRITPFPAGEIVPALQVLDSVQQGSVECGHTPALFYFGKEPALAFFTCVPFGMNRRQMAAWMRYGDGMKLADELFAGFNCIFMNFGDTGTQMGGWFRNEIRGMQDVRGLKFRIAGLGGLVFERLGAVPTQIAPGDIYPSLERGVIDAAEFIGPYDDEKLGLNRIARFYNSPGFWEPCSMGGFVANRTAWNALPAHYRTAVEVALGEIDTDQNARYDALNPPALRRLIAGGAQLRSWPREVMQTAWREAHGLYEDLSGRSPAFRKVWDNYRTFRNEQYQWFRVVDNAFDNFAFAEAARS